jgi:hypothetical protein
MDRHRPWAAAVAVLFAGACSIPVREPRLHEASAPPPRTEKAPELKVHMKSGELLVLTEWTASPGGDRISGRGRFFDPARASQGEPGWHDVAVADVALLETNAPESIRSLGLGIIATTTALLGSITGACAISPKSCFGSCPTFYLEDARGREPDRPQAEGFSESIARVLEARDLDALLVTRPPGSEVALVMRNEALETHAVRRVRLVAAPRPEGGRVLAGPGDRLFAAGPLVPPLECRAPEGDCGPALAALDGADRASETDGRDLAAREIVELRFPPASGTLGVAIAARHTLLSTFLFYQTMAYTGRRSGTVLAAMERGGPEAGRRALGMARALGGIEVEVREGGGAWRPAGTFDEAGPIAGDLRVVPFEAGGSGPIGVRLRLARGHFRIDAVALARLGGEIAPVRVEPLAVERGRSRDERALALLRDGERHLVTRAGDAYRLRFRLPEGGAPFELFLESEGFYYEWMREEWLAEEDVGLAALAVLDPREALRRLAPLYKEREGGLERSFWKSRFRSRRSP